MLQPAAARLAHGGRRGPIMVGLGATAGVCAAVLTARRARGRVAVAELAVARAHGGRLAIDSLKVGTLTVERLLVERPPRHGEQDWPPSQ